MTAPAAPGADPAPDCALCPRLHGFLKDWREREPDWHNAPVPTWTAPEGPQSVRLLVAGLAPGLRGANRTGRPFFGDASGDLLYATMAAHGFARNDGEDGFRLFETAVTNAVRCVPPGNKPTAAEINNCRPFLTATIAGFERLKVIVTLGRIAHESTVRALGGRISAHPFEHGSMTVVDRLTIVSSYHCSRYNTNTGRLTPDMFDQVFAKARALLG